MFHKAGDLVIVAAIASLALILILSGELIPVVQVVFGLLLVLVLPGYAVTSAAIPDRRLGHPEHLLLAFGISVAVTALGGLALNWTPWGLQAQSWGIYLSMITLIASIIGIFRRWRSSSDQSPSIRIGLSKVNVLFLGLAALVALSAIGLSRAPAPNQDLQGYTLLWLQPVDDSKENSYRVGMRSMEFTSVTYRLDIANELERLHEWPAISLKPGETWESNIELTPEQVGAGPVRALLFRQDAPPWPPYRHVELWP